MNALLLRLKRALLTLLKVRSESRQPISRNGEGKLRWGMGILFALLVALLYPGRDLVRPLDIPTRGEVAPADIRAPFALTLLKSERALELEHRTARSAIPFPLVVDTAGPIASLERLREFIRVSDSLIDRRITGSRIDSVQFDQVLGSRFPELSPQLIGQTFGRADLEGTGAYVALLLDSTYTAGVLDDTATLPDLAGQLVQIRDRTADRIRPLSQIATIRVALARILTRMNQDAGQLKLDAGYAYALARLFMSANLLPDRPAYEAAVAQELARVSPVRDRVNAHDLLVRAGDRVTERQEQLLAELVREHVRRDGSRGWIRLILPTILRFLVLIGLIALLFLYLNQFRRELYASYQKIFAIFLVIGLQLALVRAATLFDDSSLYLYPVALLPILITILFDLEVGFVTLLVTSLMLGFLERFNFQLCLYMALTGAVAAYMSRRVRKRSAFFRIILATSVTAAGFALLIEGIHVGAGSDVLAETLSAALNGLVCGLLTIGLLPFFEALFGFTTDITLLELSEPNHPLLRRLALEAPGTYHHSLIVGNLSEAAAKAISANSLLARVGCYYHDIGKIEIPEYFVENQLGIKSKHESLTPSMSALILTAHVKKGRLLGEQYDIPDDVLNFIEEHHGTMVMTYFYDKAVKLGEDPATIDTYRYPGPKPQTRETGIAMLADAVEAASRTLDDPKPARIDSLIDRIINNRFQSGELDECPLTLRDLAKIKSAFSQVLVSAFHHRIDYPKQEKYASV